MILHKNIRLLTWFNFFLDFRFYAPVAILYFSNVSGSFALGMSIFSITMLSSALFEVPTGIYSDMIGRKKTLVLGAFTTVISVIFYAIGGSYTVLVVGAVLEGLARSFYSGNNLALLHDTLAETNQEKEYAEYMGKTGYSAQAALAVSAVIGSAIAHFSYAWVMWLSVIPAIIGLFISTKMVEPTVHNADEQSNVFAHLKEALKQFKTNSKLRTLSIASIIGYAQGEAGYQFKAAFYATVWPVWAIGLASIISNGGAALSFYLSGTLIRRFGNLPLILTGKLYSIVTNTISLVFPTIASPAIMSSNSLFFGTGTVATSSLKQKEYTQKQRSTMGSLNALGESIGFAVVSLGLGLVADILTPSMGLLSLQILALISLGIFWNLFRK